MIPPKWVGPDKECMLTRKELADFMDAYSIPWRLLHVRAVKVLPATFFQQDNGNIELVTSKCSVKLGCAIYHGKKTIYWAWDRSLGAWVHYVG